MTEAQWPQLTQAVQERSEGAAAVAAIELQIDAERRCRHCQAGGAVRRGKTRGLRRYSCKQCGKTFNALSGTALSGLHHKQRWLTLGRSLVERESVRESAQRCGVAVTTAFRESDIYELLKRQREHRREAGLLVRANASRQRKVQVRDPELGLLVRTLESQPDFERPVKTGRGIVIDSQGGRRARAKRTAVTEAVIEIVARAERLLPPGERERPWPADIGNWVQLLGRMAGWRPSKRRPLPGNEVLWRAYVQMQGSALRAGHACSLSTPASSVTER